MFEKQEWCTLLSRNFTCTPSLNCHSSRDHEMPPERLPEDNAWPSCFPIDQGVNGVHTVPTVRIALFAFSVILFTGCAGLSKQPPKRIAAIVTEYRHNSHADVIVGRLVESHTLDGKGEFPNLKLVSLYTDQVPSNDTSLSLIHI